MFVADLPLFEQTRIEVEKLERETEAADLLREARAAERNGDWRRAARRYEQSARLRTSADELAGRLYALAGRAYHFAGRPDRANGMHEEAAERTLIHGDVVQATRNFIRAAMAAEEAGNRLRAVELGWKAYHLIKSPVLSERDRNDLQRHFELATG